MDLENTPGQTSAEQAAVAAYEEAHFAYAENAMEVVLDYESAEEEKAEGIGRVVAQVEEAYSRLSPTHAYRSSPLQGLLEGRKGWATVSYSHCSEGSDWEKEPLRS